MTLLELIDKVTLAGTATTVALVLSVITFWRQEVGKRAASLTVTCEHIPGSGKTASQTYVVVHNAGPAAAKDLAVKFRKDHENTDPIERGKALQPTGQAIPAGHSLRLRFMRALGTHSDTLEVTWRDRRRGTQTLVAPVNMIERPGPPIVNVTVEQPGQLRPGRARGPY